MNRLRWLSLLMTVTILGLTGFQLFWLRQNYAREKRALAIKTELSFRETVQHLQGINLKLEGLPLDTFNKSDVKIIVRDATDEQLNIRFKPRDEIVSTINVIQTKLADSLKHKTGPKKGMFISLKDLRRHEKNGPGSDTTLAGPRSAFFYQMLYGVDSLQDSIKVAAIDTAYRSVLLDQQLNIPFTVVRLDSGQKREPAFNEVTVGFARPITYRLELGNTFPYLIKRITLPILFSLLLMGITVLSFILLYKNLQRQQRLAQLKNEFISNITHELKTPIATVGVAIEALRNFGAAQSPEKTKEYLDISAAELQRLNLLVDKVLKLSMFENKEVELRKEVFDMSELVNEVTTIMKLQFEKRNARVDVQYSGEHFFIEADRLHITSVLYNLLDNALKYSGDQPAIEISLAARDTMLELKVKDNGNGIPREYHPRVFDKFFRVPQGNQHNTKGYGLGLSYVKEIITGHGGQIRVDSLPGKGSEFTITLPLVPSPALNNLGLA